MHDPPRQGRVDVDGVGAEMFNSRLADVAGPYERGLDAAVGGIS